MPVRIPYDEGVYLDKPWLVIRWNPDHLCVHAEFKAFANTAEFRAGCQTIPLGNQGTQRGFFDQRQAAP